MTLIIVVLQFPQLRCAVLSCEELNGQYTMLQQRCTDQGTELAQARVDYKRASVELAESHSKVSPPPPLCRSTICDCSACTD